LSHSTSSFLWWIFLELFAQVWLQTVILLVSASWVARITGMSHRHPAFNSSLIDPIHQWNSLISFIFETYFGYMNLL
jgi:hypothetical protein